MWFQKSEESVILKIKAQPNASKTKVVGLFNDHLKIALNAPPQDGKANKELVRFLSRELCIPKSQIEFLRGENSREKLLKVPLTPTLEEFLKEFDER